MNRILLLIVTLIIGFTIIAVIHDKLKLFFKTEDKDVAVENLKEAVISGAALLYFTWVEYTICATFTF